MNFKYFCCHDTAARVEIFGDDSKGFLWRKKIFDENKIWVL
jgi:hypothetical protein